MIRRLKLEKEIHDSEDELDKIPTHHLGFCPLGFIPTTEETMEDGIFQLCPEMQKVADPADISVLFFSAGANFWAILGHFWANLGNYG